MGQPAVSPGLMSRACLLVLLLGLVAVGCGRRSSSDTARSGESFAELRTVKGAVRVTEPGENSRRPFPRERLVDGESVEVPAGGLTWMRRDGGATWLVGGPAKLTMRRTSVELNQGRAFVDSEIGDPVTVSTPRGSIELADARASLDVTADGAVNAYVLRGTARAGGGARATAGELMTLEGGGKVARRPMVAWEDWTGGLATADPAADPAPFGIGTVGARKPGDKGKPRFSLVIQRMDVNVRIDHDFAVTEVDQTFVNPSSDTVEGIFSFRTPPGAVLQRFGIDRDGAMVFGRVKESAAAVQQYESNVYEGSEEDPALLQWAGAGVYNARLYPIKAGARRRVVTRYTEWLTRNGERAERRLYVYPMAAEGAKGSLPRIEELTVTIDLGQAAAKSVRFGMGGKRDGSRVIVKQFDFVPRADLALELFDDGQMEAVAYRAPHRLDAQDTPENASADFAAQVAREESDYIALPLQAPPPAASESEGLDLAVVVDTSAATEPSALALARTIATSLLTHLGPQDRAALWAGDASLRPVADGSGALSAVDPNKRKAWLAGLAAVDRGGATDIGALLTEAASRLDPKRRGAVVYIGDGSPSVGELAPKALRERLDRLPSSARILAAAVGSQPNIALLETVVRGAPLEQVFDGYGAARSALHLLEAAGRPVWLGAKLDLGSGVERVLPRSLPPISSDDTVIVVGRVAGKLPSELTLRGSGGVSRRRMSVRWLDDSGDLRRRWGGERLAQLMADGAGRASLVDLCRRFGLVSPFTSLYVPTKREAATENASPRVSEEDTHAKLLRWKPWAGGGLLARREEPLAETVSMVREDSDNKEGGTGTRAKGEEGSMGAPAGHRYAVAGPKDNAPSTPEPVPPPAQPGAPKAALDEARQLGAIGLLKTKPEEDSIRDGEKKVEKEPVAKDLQAAEASDAPRAPSLARAPAAAASAAPAATTATAEQSGRGNMWGDDIGGAMGGAGLGLSGVGEGGGGKKAGGGLAGISGKPDANYLRGGSHASASPAVRMGATTVSGRLPPEVVQRIVRQNFGRFRLCYEKGLNDNPNLAGRVVVAFTIATSGQVSKVADGGSDLPNRAVVACVVGAFNGLSFPAPEGGVVNVNYPILFSPGATAAPDSGTEPFPKPTGEVGSIGHFRQPCGPGADLPLSERVVLWRERLASVTSVGVALGIYHQSLRDCEASDWRERSALLVQIVDRLPTISDRVQLWRSLLVVSPTAADAVYRFLLLRVQTSQDLKELHDALGLERIDPDLLAALLRKARSPSERLALLRGSAEKFPDDSELALVVLEAYEDAHDDAGGRAWARKLRRRVDASTHIRTDVGEYYLRMAAHETGTDAKRDLDEARRTFDELVEFAPEDPLSRRLLGDLLRAHGWYDEALRQYQTLADLTPDDPVVPLLLAAAAQGTGRIEEAVRWSEKAAATGSPDSASSVALAARAMASAFLAWARQDSAAAHKTDEVERLRARAARLAATGSESGVRFVVTWAHPELRPALWTNALGSMMPARDNLPLLGVAQAFVPSSPAPVVELRLDPEDAARAARFDVKATVTAISGEGTGAERIARQDVGFRGPDGKPLAKVALRFDGGALVQEAP